MGKLGATAAWMAAAGAMALGSTEAAACERSHAATARARPAHARSLAELMAQVDGMIAAKCGCENAGDCTCRKGQCACSKCRKSQADVVEQLQGRQPDLLRIDNARYDASAGVFI